MKKTTETTSANRYGAFLRGVNVKGTNMKMAAVCAVFEKEGMENVSSVLASGNILFSSVKNKTELKKILEKAMSEYFVYQAFLFLKTQQELTDIVTNNPFEVSPEYHIYGFICVDDVENTLLSEFEKAKKTAGEEAKMIEGNFYWKVAKGNTLASEFGKILGRKALKDSFTSRNINTFEKVLKKMF